MYKKSEIAWRLAAGGRLGEAGAGIRAVIAGHLSVSAPAFANGACSQASELAGAARTLPFLHSLLFLSSRKIFS